MTFLQNKDTPQLDKGRYAGFSVSDSLSLFLLRVTDE